MTIKISEIVETLIGEEPAAGFPCILIRFAGCNLSCSWCDTQNRFTDDKEYSVDDLIEIVRNSSRPWTLITGGEPLLQNDAPNLMRALNNMGIEVLIETNGTMDISVVPSEIVKSVDCKTPSSNFAGSFLKENRLFLNPRDAVKFIIADRNDFDWAISEADILDLWIRAQVIFSPVYRRLEDSKLAEWILEVKRPIRLSAQLHKIWNIP